MLRAQHIVERGERLTEYSRVVCLSHPLCDKSRVNAPEIGRIPQITIVQVRQARHFAVHSAADRSTDDEHRPSRAVIGAGSVRLRQSLIAGEVALTVVLLAAAGLLHRDITANANAGRRPAVRRVRCGVERRESVAVMRRSYIKSLTISRGPAGTVNAREAHFPPCGKVRISADVALLRGDMAKSVTIPT